MRKPILVKNAMQGVGFCRSVYRPAREWKLTVWMLSYFDRVNIEVEGSLLKNDEGVLHKTGRMIKY